MERLESAESKEVVKYNFLEEGTPWFDVLFFH